MCRTWVRCDSVVSRQPQDWKRLCRSMLCLSKAAVSAMLCSPMTTAGVLDDLMVTNAGDHLFVVVNAGCKHQDLEHMHANLDDRCLVQESR